MARPHGFLTVPVERRPRMIARHRRRAQVELFHRRSWEVVMSIFDRFFGRGKTEDDGLSLR